MIKAKIDGYVSLKSMSEFQNKYSELKVANQDIEVGVSQEGRTFVYIVCKERIHKLERITMIFIYALLVVCTLLLNNMSKKKLYFYWQNVKIIKYDFCFMPGLLPSTSPTEPFIREINEIQKKCGVNSSEYRTKIKEMFECLILINDDVTQNFVHGICVCHKIFEKSDDQNIVKAIKYLKESVIDKSKAQLIIENTKQQVLNYDFKLNNLKENIRKLQIKVNNYLAIPYTLEELTHQNPENVGSDACNVDLYNANLNNKNFNCVDLGSNASNVIACNDKELTSANDKEMFYYYEDEQEYEDMCKNIISAECEVETLEESKNKYDEANKKVTELENRIKTLLKNEMETAINVVLDKFESDFKYKIEKFLKVELQTIVGMD